ncbi:hypothetical protein A7K99_01670 [Tatumella citrea]|uniref:Transposase n=1 Tax=Tatumella citrea TaxID=53336 RepID=A0A1Y0LGJ2_TATCI|nr:hypothetical protein A7K98_01670 [Tatumella citrea]ARU96648.1 hypothetical protein A7K99_01670 [Tatumella citrea]
MKKQHKSCIDVTVLRIRCVVYRGIRLINKQYRKSFNLMEKKNHQWQVELHKVACDYQLAA